MKNCGYLCIFDFFKNRDLYPFPGLIIEIPFLYSAFEYDTLVQEGREIRVVFFRDIAQLSPAGVYFDGIGIMDTLGLPFQGENLPFQERIFQLFPVIIPVPGNVKLVKEEMPLYFGFPGLFHIFFVEHCRPPVEDGGSAGPIVFK